ncbi:MAG: DinB family protein [Bacteroidota bacterium]
MDLIIGSHTVLRDALFYLEQLTTEEYARPLPQFSGSSVGQHTRHFIEFYQCLLAQAPQRRINYCLRQRDYGIETDPQRAISAIEALLPQLVDLHPETELLLDTDERTCEAPIRSTVGRELYYNVEHTIHHLALIRVGLFVLRPDLKLPEDFGVAPSTIRHRKMAQH